MKMTNKFVSVVTLGNFNPAILKANFLRDSCRIDLGVPNKEEFTPIQSRIDYGNISFLAHLDRLQIIENQPSDFIKSKIVTYLDVYLHKLEHTPISACGINYNIEIADLDTKKIQNYFMKDKVKLLEFFKAKEIVIGSLTRFKDDKKEEIFNYNFGCPLNEDCIVRITVEKQRNLVHNVNYNYEVRNLEKKRDLLRVLIENYPKRCEDYNSFVSTFLA